MLRTKNKILRLSSIGVVAMLVLVTTFAFLPKALATQDSFEAVGGSIMENAAEEDRFVKVEVKALKDVTIYDFEGEFTPTEETDANLALTKMNPSATLTDIVDVQENSTSDGKFYWKNAAEGAEFTAGDVIWSAIYVVGEDVSEMNRSMPVMLTVVSFGSGVDAIEDETLDATIVVTPLPSQGISYETTAVTKAYGDEDFTNELTVDDGTTPGAITYTSSDEEVATVDADTGEVAVVAPGTVTISATAEATDDYKETTVSYELTVNKASVTIENVGVEDKTYDGTTTATVSNVTLSEDGLDYDAKAVFVDVDAGTSKTAVVKVTLTNESADLYTLTEDTAETTATIAAFELDETNVTLGESSFVFSGSDNEPAVTVTAELDGETAVALTKDLDYTVAYDEDTVTVGTKTVKVTPTGNFTSTSDIEVTYAVEQYEITASDVTLEYDAVRYNGAEKQPSVTVKIGDYTVDASEYAVAYSNNVEVGENATVTVTASSDKNIKGSAVKTFQILDKETLEISGVETQSVVYTGSPVELVGTLAVSENSDGITVDDLTTTWYAADAETAISQPTTVGSYVVKYTYDGDNYAGTLAVAFDITKAASPEPIELSGLRVEAGLTLADISGTRTTGFSWADASTVVLAGDNNYAATYAYNDDATNYETLNLNISVYGLTRVNITVDASEGGLVYNSSSALEGDSFSLEFEAEDGYELANVLINEVDVTDLIEDNVLTLAAGTADIDAKVNFRKVYEIIEGDGEKYTVASGVTATFKIDADYELFTAGGQVYVDDTLVDEKYYTHASGSTVITLSEEFVATLNSGDHTLAVVFSDGGIARATFNVTNPVSSAVSAPDTGVFTANKSAEIAGFSVALVVLGATGLVLRKKFSRSSVDFDKK